MPFGVEECYLPSPSSRASDMLLTPDDVEAGLEALVDELASAGVRSNIYIVGGAAIVYHVERGSLTADVDALLAPGPSFDAAVRRVAQANRWDETWLNDAVKMWESHYTTEDDWQLHISRGDVPVLIAKPPLLLAMKLRAGRGHRDLYDISLLLEVCGVTSMKAAEAVFDRYCPTEVIAPKAMSLLQLRFIESAVEEDT